MFPLLSVEFGISIAQTGENVKGGKSGKKFFYRKRDRRIKASLSEGGGTA